MYGKKKEKSKYSGCLIILMAIMSAICFSVTAGNNNRKLDPNDPNDAKVMYQQMAQLERQITTQATQGFGSSLEMKENVDFVLTPALLMQEAISDEIIITYPTE
jgi:hypothetical protein